jgi:ribosomal protein S18 acetylase RimI-like enzyme
MQKLGFIEFDSQILKRNVYRFYLNEGLSGSLELPNVESKSLVYCFAKFSPRNFQLLFDQGFRLISIRNTYQSSHKKQVLTSDSIEPYRIKSHNEVKSLTEEQVEKFAKILLLTSRYSKDEKLEPSDGLSIYKNWLNNSLFQGYADECLYITYLDEIIGLAALKIKDDLGIVDQIAVLSGYQRKGFGKKLLLASIEYFNKKNLKVVEIVTEGENIAANAFYQKNGFTIKDVQLVFHKHYD